MNGFCGVVDWSRVTDHTDRIRAAMAALPHHPKEEVWSSDIVILAQRGAGARERGGESSQLYDHPTRGLIVVGDVRLDDRNGLRRQLSTTGLTRDASDLAILTEAYLRWGIDFPDHIRGDFAVALWDATSRRLVCARDIVGARPFYYASIGDRFVFSNHLEALLRLFGQRRLDAAYLREYLHFSDFYHPERTFYADVHKLAPAHVLVVQRKGVRRHRYWRPQDVPVVRHESEAGYFEQLRELLGSAVETRLGEETRSAVHLSGGLDSSSVAALAARIARKSGSKLDAISWSPPPTADARRLDDERALVEAVAQRSRLPVRYTPMSADSLAEEWSTDVTRHPLQTTLWERVAGRLVAADGIRVVLSGWGGDETAAFNGRGYTADLFLRGKWMTLARELRLRARRLPSRLWAVRSRIILPLLPDSLAGMLSSAHRRDRKGLTPALTSHLQQTLESQEPMQWDWGRERAGARRNQLRLLALGHLSYRMESWYDMGAMSGIEYRYPMLDRRLVEFSLGVPESLFFRNGWKRYLFRKTVEDLLPRPVVWKNHKSDPAVAHSVAPLWDAAAESAAEMVLERRREIRAAGWVDPDRLVDELRSRSSQSDPSQPGFPAAIRALFLAFLHPDTTIR